MVELIIIGAGPAGITAGVYAARKQIDFLILTEDVGGQAALSGDIENYTGYQFITGTELVAKFEEHLEQFQVKFKSDESVQRVLKGPADAFLVRTQKAAYEARTVMVASGRRPRWLNIPGEKEFLNKGLTYCATCDGPLFVKKTVAVIGGGNSALDAVLQMMKIAQKVYLVNINSRLEGDAVMRRKVASCGKVVVLNGAATRQIKGETFVKSMVVEQEGKLKEIPLDGVFVEIGSIPNSDLIDFVEKNQASEIVVDQLNRTSAPGIFAAGDVTNIPEKQIIVAAGEGAKAVLGVFRYLSQRKPL